MSPPDDGEVEGQPHVPDRHRKLERECRRLRRSHRRLRVAVAVLAVVAAVPLVSAATSIETPATVEELRIVGEAGTTRMVLTSQISREAVFYGRRIIRNSPDAAGVVVYDGDGMEQGAIAVPDAGDGPVLRMTRDGEEVLRLPEMEESGDERGVR